MENENVRKASIILNLDKSIIGIKFIDFKEDYEALELPNLIKKGPVCYHSREAMEGKIFKIVSDGVSCDYGRYALGLDKPDSTIVEGRSFKYCGLSETNAIGKEIVASMKYIEHQSYGIAMGPLELMDDADLVMIVDEAATIMRIMQGYAYKFGNPENLSFFGNQAACADLISKPHSNNDINISLLCRGARANGRFEKGELGVSVPIGMFDSLVEGIVKTLTPVANATEKKRVLSVIEETDPLNEEIDLKYNYGMGLIEYDERVKALRKSD